MPCPSHGFKIVWRLGTTNLYAHLFAARVEEIFQLYDILVLQFPHDLQLAILEEEEKKI